ncbi:MAG: M56 family metallopeptidase, partial [Luteitalea sp.]
MSALAFVLSWVAHSTALALVALLMPRLFGVRHPGLLVFWWQGGAAGVVLLPLIPLLLPLRPTGSGNAVDTSVERGANMLAPKVHTTQNTSKATLLALLLLIGVAVRLGWLVAGQRHLTRLAAAGTPVEHDPALAQARATTGVQVPVIAAASAGPCAFGFSQVRVLVPEALRERPDDQRLAVYLHELVHVVRCDVQRAYGDETWRVIWWWQPSVWWLLARLQLAREYEVDQAVIRQAVPRRAYVDALLWCSGLRPVWSLSPQVGGSHHALVRRVTMFCEEVEMSRMRRWITASAMVLTSATAAAVVGVVTPLQATRLGQTGDATEAGPLE